MNLQVLLRNKRGNNPRWVDQATVATELAGLVAVCKLSYLYQYRLDTGNGFMYLEWVNESPDYCVPVWRTHDQMPEGTTA